jgi:hypothetical protein
MRSERVRLGVGATVPDGANFFAQRRFFEAIARVVPKALAELAVIAAQPPGQRNASMLGWLDIPTEEALQQWADRWGIPQPAGWWMRQVRAHVTHWREFPKVAGRWQGFTKAYREPEWPTLAWNANEECERDFRSRVDTYIKRVKSLPGIRPTPETFKESDFDALVLEHVAQEPIPKILELLRRHDGDESTVRKRNQDLADVLGLKLRRRPRGRPNRKSGKH